jgi:pimeloyl-ACP methyl ester carboxylesterase
VDRLVIRRQSAGALDVAFLEAGIAEGPPVVLLHGFPYDPHAYDEVAPILASRGCRVIVPYLRSFGSTRFRSADTPRSGQQAALGSDLLALIDALSLERPVVAGYDWGGRAACVVAALWPERVRGLVSGGGDGYNIQNIATSMEPQAPEYELRYWYQFYFHSERGREGLARNRHAFCKLLWKLWSPNWVFDDATYDRSAASFEIPDFVDVVIHSYRHRYALVAGDPALEDIERRLAAQPAIAVPTVALHGEANSVLPAAGLELRARRFSGPYQRTVIARIGHNVPQEAPTQFAEAVLSLL